MKPTFPAAYSTLAPASLQTFIASAYGLHDVECRFLVRGVSDTYLAEAMGVKYIFRIYRSSHYELTEIAAEAELLTALKTAGVSVSFPVADRQGQYVQSFHAAEGERHAMLFSYAEGVVVNALNNDQLRNLGLEMAQFHNVSAAIRLTGVKRHFDIHTTLWEPLTLTKDCFPSGSDHYSWLCDTARKIEIELQALDTGEFSSGYCHYDFLPKNFHFDGHRVTFFDFGFLGYGWLVNDLMTFRTQLCLDIFFKRISREQAEKSFGIFLDGYREQRALTAAELQAIPLLSLGFWLFYMGFHTTHDQFYPLVFEKNALEMRTGLIRQLIETNLDWNIQ